MIGEATGRGTASSLDSSASTATREDGITASSFDSCASSLSIRVDESSEVVEDEDEEADDDDDEDDDDEDDNDADDDEDCHAIAEVSKGRWIAVPTRSEKSLSSYRNCLRPRGTGTN